MTNQQHDLNQKRYFKNSSKKTQCFIFVACSHSLTNAYWHSNSTCLL